MEQKEKKVVSNILTEKRNWHDCKELLPDEGVTVVIRFTNPSIIFGEDENTIYPAEDIKLAKYIDGKFNIAAPFPKYDFSPLSDRDTFKEGTIVTHWAEPEEGEIDGWLNRFGSFHVYKHLSIKVDKFHEKDVYRALLMGASALARLYGLDPRNELPENASEELKDLDNLYKTLCDLQAYMDNPKDENFNCDTGDED